MADERTLRPGYEHGMKGIMQGCGGKSDVVPITFSTSRPTPRDDYYLTLNELS